MQDAPTPQGPAGWYPDPWSDPEQRLLRFFDGAVWTNRIGADLHVPARPAGFPAPPQDRPITPQGKVMHRAGGALIAVAVLVVGFFTWEVVGTNVTGLWAQRDAREELADAAGAVRTAPTAPSGMFALSPFEPLPDRTAPADRAGAETVPTTPAEPQPVGAGQVRELPAAGTVIGRIVIPKIGVDKVFAAGTDTDTLKAGPGVWEYGSFLGPGNTTISGHRTTYGGPFRHIDSLELGDRIEIHLPGEPVQVFEVRGNAKVDPSEVGVTAHTGGVRLTLTTCDPVGSAAQRLVVQAEMVEGPWVSEALPVDGWTFQR